MKRILLITIAFSFLCGCVPFGTFSRLKQGETTKNEVGSLLGEPANKVLKKGGEVWEYNFMKRDRNYARGQKTIINFSVSFKEDMVDNYKITVYNKSMPEKDAADEGQLRPAEPTTRPAFKPKGGIMEKFGKNNDSRVSREEFPGPDRVFNKFDRNGDGYIDEKEASKGPQRETHNQKRDFIEDFDKDKDSRVSIEEFRGPDKVFNIFDRNGDGYIDESEVPKGPPQRSHSPRRSDSH